MRRSLALLLSLVLCWSGLATHEMTWPWLLSAAELPLSLDDGSVEDHYIDDQPAQAQAEAAPDLTGLPRANAEVAVPAHSESRPASRVRSELAPPFLASALRPPSRMTVSA